MENLNGEVLFHPCERLASWLAKRNCPIKLFEIKEIPLATLRKYLKKIKGNRSSGIDLIDSFSLKLASPYIEHVLLHLVNLSIRNRSYPQPWKTQLIHPFFKKGEKTSGENYRPVSHIVEVSKLLEYVVFDQILEHFTTESLLHPNHHGYIPNHNTITQVYILQMVHNFCYRGLRRCINIFRLVLRHSPVRTVFLGKMTVKWVIFHKNQQNWGSKLHF